MISTRLLLSKCVINRPSYIRTALRFTSSSTTSSESTPPSKDSEKFNTEFTQKDYDEHVKETIEYEKSDGDGKKHIEFNIKGFKDLQEKGNRTAEEQDRPEDYM
ncbi:hypothetical protein WICMUC_005956 [Wickerhamomyces mucosus]|uniref:Uncharacterized protein n=1 Tax=Wickerhamomyces mucosus TaxID=1378264 RepID=A0A9P8P1J3_9ASCO|nr:hypothetical protein WICMUC_005956 [Wickerhamomyces mucosus]